jgi:hypothetical protein
MFFVFFGQLKMWFIFGMLVLLQVWDIESGAEYNFKGTC